MDIYHCDMPKSCLDFADLYLVFEVDIELRMLVVGDICFLLELCSSALREIL